jgi:cytochrome c-type biogenesis protein
MPGPEITPDLIAALATGVLSLVSPCAWPVVFAVLFLAALTVLTPVQGERPGLLARLVPVHLFFLCIGFGLMFFLLGLPTSWLGYWTWVTQDTLRTAGALMWVIVGLNRVRYRSFAGWALALTAGAALALAWPPCPGRVLTVITLMIGDGQLGSNGQWLLGAYALGQTMLLFLISLAFYQLLDILPKERRLVQIFRRLSAGAAIVVGVLMFFNLFEYLTPLRANFFPL